MSNDILTIDLLMKSKEELSNEELQKVENLLTRNLNTFSLEESERFEAVLENAPTNSIVYSISKESFENPSDELINLFNDFFLNDIFSNHQPLKVKIFVIALAKLVEKTYKNEIEYDGTPIDVGKRKGKTIITAAVFEQLNSSNVKLSEELTSFDREIFNAVSTIYVSGNRIFTPVQVYECMTGNSKPRNEALEEIKKSIEKQRRIFVTIDCTNQLNEYIKNKKLNAAEKTYFFRDALLNLEDRPINFNGQIKMGYAFSNAPILYRYSYQFGQIASVDIARLGTPTSLYSTTDFILIRSYLVQRIERMKKSKSKNTSRKILYATLYKECGMINLTRSEQKRIRDKINALLKMWQEQKYIKGYKEEKENENKNAKITGISIVL